MTLETLERRWFQHRLTGHASSMLSLLAQQVPIRQLQTLGVKVQYGLRLLEGDFVVWAAVPPFAPAREEEGYGTYSSADAVAAVVRDGICTTVCATRRSQCRESREPFAPASAHWAVKEVV